MNGLSDSLSIGILITLVFGALFFYLYSRQLQTEKRTGLIEQMLMDLKMSSENLWSNLSTVPAPTESNGGFAAAGGEEEFVENIKPVSEPTPLESDDVDAAEEDYASALASATIPTAASTSADLEERKLTEILAAAPVAATSKTQANYSSMTLKELKQLAKQRGLTHSHNAGKREITDLLQKSDAGKPAATPPVAATLEPVAGTLLGTMIGSADILTPTDFETSS